MKTANRARVAVDGIGVRWVEKDLALATKRFGHWPLVWNERLAAELSRRVGGGVPDLVIEDTRVRSRWAGTALCDLTADERAAPSLRAALEAALTAQLLFAAWIGDADRTVHHMLVGEDGSLASIDFEFCGWKPPACRYPEDEPPLTEPAHVSCLHAFRAQRPTSARLREYFGARVPTHDDYPHNASAAYFAMRETGARLSSGGAVAALLDAIATLDGAALDDTCAVCYPPELAAQTAAYLRARATILPEVWSKWQAYLSVEEARCEI